MTIKYTPNTIVGIIGPFSHLLTSYMLPQQDKLYIYNPFHVDLYIPKLTNRISKVQFKIAYQYEKDQLETIIDELIPINQDTIQCNNKTYTIKHLSQFEIITDGLVLFLDTPSPQQLYEMRKHSMSVIINCDEFLDYEAYDMCFSTNYSHESLKKTEFKGYISILKPYTTDLHVIQVTDEFIVEPYHVTQVIGDEKPANTEF